MNKKELLISRVIAARDKIPRSILPHYMNKWPKSKEIKVTKVLQLVETDEEITANLETLAEFLQPKKSN